MEPQEPQQDPGLILSQSEVKGYPCVFVLGYNATQVTVYSQQVRALNLIWALNRTRPLEGKKVVVVGGGIAGVTASAAAMLCGGHVTILVIYA
jgi:NADPH-dependent 2,4-dienoyl-CoA reductase/sulfur reductase-like enzyme